MTVTYSAASFHSIERAKERIGYNKRNAERQIDRAIARGKTAEHFSSWERKFLHGECSESATAIAYDNFCYIISETGVCKTLYPLPAWFGKKKHFNGKEKIRKMKSYTRNHPSYNEDYTLFNV